MTKEFRRTFFVIVGDVFFTLLLGVRALCVYVCMHVLSVHVCMCDRVHNVQRQFTGSE